MAKEDRYAHLSDAPDTDEATETETETETENDGDTSATTPASDTTDGVESIDTDLRDGSEPTDVLARITDGDTVFEVPADTEVALEDVLTAFDHAEPPESLEEVSTPALLRELRARAVEQTESRTSVAAGLAVTGVAGYLLRRARSSRE